MENKLDISIFTNYTFYIFEKIRKDLGFDILNTKVKYMKSGHKNSFLLLLKYNEACSEM